jgi:hypothetical protein
VLELGIVVDGVRSKMAGKITNQANYFHPRGMINHEANIGGIVVQG